MGKTKCKSCGSEIEFVKMKSGTMASRYAEKRISLTRIARSLGKVPLKLREERMTDLIRKKDLERIVLQEAVSNYTAGREVGETFDLEKINYANKHLNEMNCFIWKRIGESVIPLEEIVERLKKETKGSSKIAVENIIYNQALLNVAAAIKEYKGEGKWKYGGEARSKRADEKL